MLKPVKERPVSLRDINCRHCWTIGICLYRSLRSFRAAKVGQLDVNSIHSSTGQVKNYFTDA